MTIEFNSHNVRISNILAAEPRYVCGLDLGQSQDFSALCVLEARGGREKATFNCRHLQRWQLGTSYPAIVDDLRLMFLRVPFTNRRATLAVDATGVGKACTDFLVKAQINADLVPVLITGGDTVSHGPGLVRVPKRDLVSCVQVVLQTGRLKIASSLSEAETLVRELTNFKIKISASGHDSYGNSTEGLNWRDMGGAHDDMVLSLACALWAGTRRQVTYGRAIGMV